MEPHHGYLPVPEFISVCQAVARHISTKLRNLIILRLAEFLDLGTCQGTFLSNVRPHITIGRPDLNTIFAASGST